METEGWARVVGWVLRDDDGRLHGVGCRYVRGMYDPLLMEIWAIVDGLKAIASRGLCLIIVESDNLTILRLLKEAGVNLTLVRSFMEEILEVSRGWD